MADRKGYSEERTGFFGNKYTEHFDEHGDRIGRSEERTGFFGNKHVEHRDSDGTYVGSSEEREGFFGNTYEQHHSDTGADAGYSEEARGFFGNEYSRHHGPDGSFEGRTEPRTGVLGGHYSEHYGRNPKARRSSAGQQRESTNPTGDGVVRSRRSLPTLPLRNVRLSSGYGGARSGGQTGFLFAAYRAGIVLCTIAIVCFGPLSGLRGDEFLEIYVTPLWSPTDVAVFNLVWNVALLAFLVPAMLLVVAAGFVLLAIMIALSLAGGVLLLVGYVLWSLLT